jgi:hypothetical protein
VSQEKPGELVIRLPAGGEGGNRHAYSAFGREHASSRGEACTRAEACGNAGGIFIFAVVSDGHAAGSNSDGHAIGAIRAGFCIHCAGKPCTGRSGDRRVPCQIGQEGAVIYRQG